MGDGVVLVWYSEVFAFPAVTVIKEVLVGRNGSRETRTRTVTNTAELDVRLGLPTRTRTVTNEADPTVTNEADPTVGFEVSIRGTTTFTNNADFTTRVGGEAQSNSLALAPAPQINYGPIRITNGLTLLVLQNSGPRVRVDLRQNIADGVPLLFGIYHYVAI